MTANRHRTVAREHGIVDAVSGAYFDIRDITGQIWRAHRTGARPAPGDRVIFRTVLDDPRGLIAADVIVTDPQPERATP